MLSGLFGDEYDEMVVSGLVKRQQTRRFPVFEVSFHDDRDQ